MKNKVLYNSYNSHIEIAKFIKDYITNNTVIVCIGTDKCIGDCLGPMVGTFLKEKNFPLPVYGTIESPIHALNINNRLNEINKLHPKSLIIGIDACLGEASSIGEIHTRDYPIHPGKGVGKNLPDVGIASIIGIIDSSENAEFFTSRSIRLHLVMEMSKIISAAIIYAYNLTHNQKGSL